MSAQNSSSGKSTPSSPTSKIAFSAAKSPEVKALSAILIDAASGQVLYSKNADLPRPPASTTKIMTAILLLEHTNPDDVIVASKKAYDTEGSSLHLLEGEQVTARDLLYALMLRSANDGCVAAAEKIAGSEARFADMMTAKAKEIGATHTTFHNSNGLNENPNVTTARDLAIMARYASRYPDFNEATQTKLYTIRRSSTSKDTLLKNHAKFLWKFPGADGIKTGYTVPAGHCFVGGATWNGWRLISVVLKSPDVITDTANLMKFGFQQFEPRQAAQMGQVYARVPVRDGARPEVDAQAKEPIRYVVHKGDTSEVTLQPRIEPVGAPILPGSVVGSLDAMAGGRIVGTVPLVAAEAVEKATAVVPVPGGAATTPFLLLGLVGGTFMVRWRYGTAIAETARRVGYRLAKIVRRACRGGSRFGQR